MKTIEITEADKPLSDYARHVARDVLVVLQKGKPLAVLSSAEGMDAESIALANNPKFVAIIQRSRARQKAEGGISAEEVRRRLGISRSTKQKAAKSRR
jgi:PHD/YefM family antitoxin component YafN of YafNO toxin-antitoxin module